MHFYPPHKQKATVLEKDTVGHLQIRWSSQKAFQHKNFMRTYIIHHASYQFTIKIGP